MSTIWSVVSLATRWNPELTFSSVSHLFQPMWKIISIFTNSDPFVVVASVWPAQWASIEVFALYDLELLTLERWMGDVRIVGVLASEHWRTTRTALSGGRIVIDELCAFGKDFTVKDSLVVRRAEY